MTGGLLHDERTALEHILGDGRTGGVAAVSAGADARRGLGGAVSRPAKPGRRSEHVHQNRRHRPARGRLSGQRGVRSSRSRSKAACQLLAYSEFTLLERGGRYVVTEATAKEMFPELRNDLELLSLASYFAQAADVLSPEGEENPPFVSLLLNALYALGRLGLPQKLVKAVFELRAMCLSGYEPDLRGCAVCGAPEPDRFNISQGVLQCAACRTEEENDIRLPMSAGTRAALRYLDSAPPSRVFSFRLAEPSLSELGQITESYLCTRLERGFSTLDFYKSLFL